MNILITGADGFIGKNLAAHLDERSGLKVTRFTRGDSTSQLRELVCASDFIFHLAGVNRPKHADEFITGNLDLTADLCAAVEASGKATPIVYTSSTQAALSNAYGESKKCAEDKLLELAAKSKAPVYIYRLPNVFGKWSRPNYNSAVATFSYNIANGLPIQINDPAATLKLLYIDDLVAEFLRLLDTPVPAVGEMQVAPVYTATVGELASQIQAFRDSRETMITERVGSGLVRALYSTYLSYLPPDRFAYNVPKHGDARGAFVEMLKTSDSGQFSYFTAHPGVTRGGHYHHSKTEKFLVIKGHACFRFKHIVTGEFYELLTHGEQPQVVETVPGWTHDITNVGSEEMLVMLWANEVFDRANPDTFAMPILKE